MSLLKQAEGRSLFHLFAPATDAQGRPIRPGGFVCTRLGSCWVEVPVYLDERNTPQHLDEQTVAWSYAGHSVLLSDVAVDLLTELKRSPAGQGEVGSWQYEWGQSDGELVYQATHRQIMSLFVRGSVPAEAMLREILGHIEAGLAADTPGR